MPGSGICASVISPSGSSSRRLTSVVDKINCKSTKATPGKIHETSHKSLKTTTTPSGTSVVTSNTTNSFVCKQSIRPSSPQPSSGQHHYPHPNSSTVGTKSRNIRPTISFSNQQKHKQPQSCTSCSSNDVIEVNIKLKSCQDCQNVVIDELHYDNQSIDDERNKAATSHSAGTSSHNQYHHHLAFIAKKLKNIYKNRIHSSTSPSDSLPAPPLPPMHQESSFVNVPSQSPPMIVDNKIPTTPIEKTPTTSDNHDHKYSSNISSISNLPLKSNSNNHLINKDVLILRICDLDLKLKSIQTDATTSTTNGAATIKSHSAKASSRNSTSTTTQEYSDNKKKPIRKIVVISDEYKRNSEKHDVRIENRKEIIKKFRQNNGISKSLDMIPPELDISLHNNFKNSPYIYSSKSVTDIHKNDDEDYDYDDDGPYESINSVELIFISDEFLNKAIKHDLKILKNKQTETTKQYNDMELNTTNVRKKLQKQSETISYTTKPNRTMSTTMTRTTTTTGSERQSTPINVPMKYGKTSISSGSSQNKKLIVISEDFKRKSLENNIVIVNDCNNIELSEKRKNLKQLKFSRQQSSIDDVGNQMISHAFRSFEEPEEECLESKEIKTPE